MTHPLAYHLIAASCFSAVLYWALRNSVPYYKAYTRGFYDGYEEGSADHLDEDRQEDINSVTQTVQARTIERCAEAIRALKEKS